jgi:membrane protease YdiL (CAAX protease family)
MRDTAARWVSGVELALGAAIVIGHNVFRVVPNEVPILVVLGLASLRVRNGTWSAVGFRRPESWRTIVLVALAAAALRILLGDFVIEPVSSHFWPPIVAPSLANEITGNLKMAVLAFFFVWAWAAFGEEIGYHGYLLRRAAETGAGSNAAWWMGVVVVAVLFGVGHFYKGPAGVLDSGVAGLILGAAFMLTRRNLWTPVLAHGFIDTVGIVFVYFGWDG